MAMHEEHFDTRRSPVGFAVAIALTIITVVLAMFS
jgi:heme/copper-type cytochrome/quinol oxidase subunit 4